MINCIIASAKELSQGKGLEMDFKIGDRVIFKVLASKPRGTIESSRMLGRNMHYYVRFDAPIGSSQLSTQNIRANDLELADSETQ